MLGLFSTYTRNGDLCARLRRAEGDLISPRQVDRTTNEVVLLTIYHTLQRYLRNENVNRMSR
jgi:hypothetical protein